MEHTKGKIFVGSTDAVAVIVGEESRDYIAGVQIQQIGGGAIAGAMEDRRKANAEHLVRCWNCHDQLLEALRKSKAMIDHRGHPEPICVDGAFPTENGCDQCQWCDEYQQIEAAIAAANLRRRSNDPEI